jgi:hypothetical protein
MVKLGIVTFCLLFLFTVAELDRAILSVGNALGGGDRLN